jgi:serine/alanine adding enzyme
MEERIHIHTFMEIDRLQWIDLVNNSSTATFFQSPKGYEFFSSLSFLSTFLFGVNEKGKLKGVICGYIQAEEKGIISYLSRRAIIPGGVLLAQDISDEALLMLLTYIKTYLSDKAIYIESRNYKDFSNFKGVFQSAGFCYHAHLNIQVDTSNVTNAFSRLSQSKKRQVRKAETAGLTWEIAENKPDISAFYTLLEKTYREKVKTPLFPLTFFEELSNNNDGHIFVVKLHNVVVGGMALIHWKGLITYEYFVCADEKLDSDYYISVYTTWKAIEYAATNQCFYFDFMGAGKPDEAYGVRDFKSKFGGQLVEYGRFRCVNHPLLYALGKIGVRIYGEMIKWKMFNKNDKKLKS